MLKNRDFLAGLLFTTFAVATGLIASSYQLGNAARMGPGYFPRLLSIVLFVLGIALIVNSLRAQRVSVSLSLAEMRALLLITTAVAVFGLGLEPLGLFAVVVIVALLASAAGSEFSLPRALATGVAMAILCHGIFNLGLGLRIPVLPALLAE